MIRVAFFPIVRCREVLSPPSVHRPSFSPEARSHHWSRVWGQDDHYWRKDHQTANMGYSNLMSNIGRAREFQVHHERLLSFSSRSHLGLRYYQSGKLQQCVTLARGGQDQWKLGDVFRGSWQQMRHGVRVFSNLSRRKISYEEGSRFAQDNNLMFLEVSAKTAYQVE